MFLVHNSILGDKDCFSKKNLLFLQHKCSLLDNLRLELMMSFPREDKPLSLGIWCNCQHFKVLLSLTMFLEDIDHIISFKCLTLCNFQPDITVERLFPQGDKNVLLDIHRKRLWRLRLRKFLEDKVQPSHFQIHLQSNLALSVLAV